MKHLVIFLMLVVSTTFAAAPENSWQLKREEQGISVSTRKVTDSSYVEFSATVFVKSELSNILDLLEDEMTYPGWFAYTALAQWFVMGFIDF